MNITEEISKREVFKKPMEKINKTKSCFFLKITKLTNLQPDLPRSKREGSNKTNERREITTDTMEIQKNCKRIL